MHKRKFAKRRLFGPGSAAMAVGIVAFAAYSWATRPGEDQVRYLEVDASGALRPVTRRSSASGAPSKVVKPEPAFLLDRAAELKLEPVQLLNIRRTSDRWTAEKASFEKGIAGATRFLDAKKPPTSIEAVRARLSEYSELSRAYGAARERAWLDAIAFLDPNQRRSVEGELASKEDRK